MPSVIEACEPNPHSLPGTALYQRFVTAWSRAPCKEVQLVFHGTHESNVDVILRDSLDPRMRRRQAYGPGEHVLPPLCVNGDLGVNMRTALWATVL